MSQCVDGTWPFCIAVVNLADKGGPFVTRPWRLELTESQRFGVVLGQKTVAFDVGCRRVAEKAGKVQAVRVPSLCSGEHKRTKLHMLNI